jgi:hypothetical protein
MCDGGLGFHNMEQTAHLAFVAGWTEALRYASGFPERIQQALSRRALAKNSPIRESLNTSLQTLQTGNQGQGFSSKSRGTAAAG